ncbi:MAG: mechanosensitive ion channel [Balneolaceae bacterium]|nr:mechanosensitive ion channel [Balneolaceae bacterium]
MDEFNKIKETAIPILVDYGLDMIGAVIILILGWAASNWFANRVRKYLERSQRIDATLTPIFATGTKVLVLVVTVLAVLNQFGVQTASIIAVVGAAGLAIGLALQGTLSNIASGMMLLILRPFNVGDVVVIGNTTAIVDEIGLFVTEMHTFDNIYVVFPNSKVWGDKIENYTRNSTRRADMVFGIHYNDDIDRAMEIIKEVFASDERVLAEPAPVVVVGQLADSSVNIFARPWTQTENLWPLKWDLTKRIKERFDEEDITIPFPQRDIHYIADNKGPEIGDPK